MRSGFAPESTRCATRCASVLVLPVPAPAMMSSGPVSELRGFLLLQIQHERYYTATFAFFFARLRAARFNAASPLLGNGRAQLQLRLQFPEGHRYR